MRPQELFAVLRDRVASSGGQGLLVGFAVLLIVGTIVAIALYVFYSRSPRARVAAMLRESASSVDAQASRWAIRLLVPAILIGALFAADAYFSRPSTCASCHREGGYQKALKASPHSSVACMECHAPSGPGSFVRRQATYSRWVAVYGVTKKAPEPRPGSVDSGSCLECHGNVSSGTVVSNGIRVRHSDILDAGGECGDCHNTTAHPGAVKRPSEPSMDQCLPCHDGTKASAECSSCHVKDVAFTPATKRGYAPRKLADSWDSCYRCHEEKPCLKCHGVTMPHPPGWGPDTRTFKGAGHAREGFVNREVCWRCHYAKGKPFQPAEEACRCHGLLGDFHNGKAWIKEHGLEATGQRGGANARCFDCHGQDFCDLCHDASYRKRYNPNPAAPPTPGYSPSPLKPEDVY